MQSSASAAARPARVVEDEHADARVSRQPLGASSTGWPRPRRPRERGDDARRRSSAGREPRNASVTWRCSRRGRSARPARCSRAPTPRARRASSGSLSARKSRSRVIATHASGRAHTSSCRLRVRSRTHEVERRDGRAARADPLAVAGKLEAAAPRSPSGPDGVEEDEPDRLLGRAAARARRRRHRDGDVGAEPRRARPAAIAAAASAETAPCVGEHRVGTRRARAALTLVRVGDDAADEDVARARHVGQPRRDEAAGARLRRRRA